MPKPLRLRRARRRPVDVSSVVAALVLAPSAVVAVTVLGSLAAHTPANATMAAVSSATSLDAALHADGRPLDERPAAVLPPAPMPATARPAARASRDAARPARTWVLPAHGPLSSLFGMRWGRMHEGIDIAAGYDAPIVAATDGTLAFAGWESGYGRLIVIRDWDGTETRYGHMSRFARTGGTVHAGDVIGYVGATGDATGPHLHFEVRIGGSPVNPLTFLRQHGVGI